MRIDTDISAIIVEIEGNEYEVAEKTVAVAEKIQKAQNDHVGKPEYQLWLAMIEIILGKSACKKLFPNGKSENLDRMERIYMGVLKAFGHNSEELEEEQRQSRSEGISEQIRPIVELMKQVNMMDKNKGQNEERNVIRRMGQ